VILYNFLNWNLLDFHEYEVFENLLRKKRYLFVIWMVIMGESDKKGGLR